MTNLLIRHESVRRGGRQVLAAGEITAALPAAVAIVGVNGSGKTSLFLHLTDSLLRQHSRAQVLLGDTPVRFGFAPQTPVLPPWLTAEQAMKLYGLEFDRVHVEFPGLHLDELARRRTGAMSLGQLQTLTAAIALAGDASLLILDEPFSALDFRRRLGLLDALARWKMAEPDRALLLSSQSASDLLELCETFVVLRDGRYVFQGSREQLTGGATPESAARNAEQRLLELLT